MKKEARIARIEVLPGSSALIIIFRGGWIDGLLAIEGGVGQGSVAGRLEGSKYLEELKGISLGEGFGAGEAVGLRAWAKSRGLPEVEIGARNRKQAQVLTEGFGRLLEGKG